MQKVAQISYQNAPHEAVNITLHVGTNRRHDNGMWYPVAIDTYPNIASKPAAIALCKSLGAVLV